jgi:hypothetical protein
MTALSMAIRHHLVLDESMAVVAALRGIFDQWEWGIASAWL